MKLLIVVNASRFFYSHRLQIALAARANGYQVLLAAARDEATEKIVEAGIDFVEVPFVRNQLDIFNSLQVFFRLWSIFWEFKPSVVHLVTAKPIIIGGIIGRLQARRLIVAIAGLGTAFKAQTITERLRKRLIIMIYKFVLSRSGTKVVFQNSFDMHLLVNHCGIAAGQCCKLPGSGVNLNEYPFVGEPDTPIVVTMASRLIKEKGVVEFCKAAEVIEKLDPRIQFRLAGEIDFGNPKSISSSELFELTKIKNLEYLGFVKNIVPLFQQSHIICHPSYYGEGLPKVLIEASALGRPIVTTNEPGCYEAVIADKTGLIVEPQKVDQLVSAILRLVEDGAMRRAMGKAGRTLAIQRYSIDSVIRSHMSLYQGTG